MLKLLSFIACAILSIKLLQAFEAGKMLQMAENAFYMFLILALVK